MSPTPKKDKALRWPIGITIGTLGIIVLCVGTIVVAVKNPVAMDNDFNNEYRYIDKNINKILEDDIAFKKVYNLYYMEHPLKTKDTLIAYTIMDAKQVPVDDAKFSGILTRPNETRHDIPLEFTNIGNGVYEAKKVDLPLDGRWNLFVEVQTKDNRGFSKLRLDSRFPEEILPFGTVVPIASQSPSK